MLQGCLVDVTDRHDTVRSAPHHSAAA
jgi:hypothetical protein